MNRVFIFIFDILSKEWISTYVEITAIIVMLLQQDINPEKVGSLA